MEATSKACFGAGVACVAAAGFGDVWPDAGVAATVSGRRTMSAEMEVNRQKAGRFGMRVVMAGQSLPATLANRGVLWVEGVLEWPGAIKPLSVGAGNVRAEARTYLRSKGKGKDKD
jgi:hypothetical protein